MPDDDLFDDWEIPSDDQWEGFIVSDDTVAESMVRRLRSLRAQIADVDMRATAEKMRIDRIAADRTHGARRAAAWIADRLADYQRARLAVNPKAERTLRFLSGGTVKANATGGQPQIRDAQAYAQWATRNEYIDRDAKVAVPWETALLAVQALRAAIEEDIGGMAPKLIAEIADVLDLCVEGGTKYTIPSYDQKRGRIRWNGEAWVDVESGEPVPGLGRAEAGFNFVVVVDQ
jgi:hypothetical protein